MLVYLLPIEAFGEWAEVSTHAQGGLVLEIEHYTIYIALYRVVYLPIIPHILLAVVAYALDNDNLVWIYLGVVAIFAIVALFFSPYTNHLCFVSILSTL